MPYKDLEKRRQVKRDSERRRRARQLGLRPLPAPADVSELPEPPSREDVLRVVAAQAMNGNIAACRLLLAEYRRDSGSAPRPGKRSVIDELVARRQRMAQQPRPGQPA